MKKRASIVVILITLLININTVHGAEPSISINICSNEVLVGENLIVEIIGSQIDDIAGGYIILNYDENKLSFDNRTINIDSNDYIDLQFEGTSLEDEDGRTKIVFGLKKDADLIGDSEGNDIVIAILEYTALHTGECTLNLDPLSKLVKSNGAGEYTYENININNGSTLLIYKLGSISGTIALEDNYIPSHEFIHLLKDGEIIETSGIDSEGRYSFNNLENGYYTLSIDIPGYIKIPDVNISLTNYGNVVQDFSLDRIEEDVNRDGIIDLADLVIIGGKFDLTKGDKGFIEDADINDDNIIDLLDLIYVTSKIQ